MNKPEIYVSNHGPTIRDTTKLLSEFIHRMSWKTGERVLDLGCGPGNVTSQVLMPLLPADFDLLVGLDVSPQMIQYATKTYKDPKLRFAECDLGKDIGNISGVWPPGFDKVFSFYCLHWIQDQKDQSKAVSNIYNFLRTGGETLLHVVPIHPIYQMYENLSRKREWQPYMKDAHQFISPYQHSSDPAQELKKLLLDTGFEVIDYERRHYDFTYENANQYKDLMRGVNPFIDRMPTELREEYLTDSVTEMMKLLLGQTHKNTDDVRIPGGYDSIVVYARKP